jgi:hypothetical protein
VTDDLKRGPYQHRRIRTIPRFFPEKSRPEQVFTALWRATHRWQGGSISETERQQLKLLRSGLGLLPEGAQDTLELKVQKPGA